MNPTIPSIAAVALLLIPLSAFGADFDCSRASTADEKLICSTPDLSKGDEMAGDAYRKAIAKAGKATMAPIARQFLARRHACGSSAGCVEAVQTQMLDAYTAIAGGATPGAAPQTADDAPPAPDPTEGDGIHSLYYGSRAGMVVDITGITGKDTPNAVLRYRHTRANAVAFCREYALKVTDKCVNDEMTSIGAGAINANCTTGKFTGLSGMRLIFQGAAPAGGNTTYTIRAADTGEVLDGSMASGYFTFLGQFKAMCPARVPKSDG